MGPQAEAVLDENATEQTEEAEMLASFADEEPRAEPTTAPAEEAPTSATSEEPESSTTEGQTDKADQPTGTPAASEQTSADVASLLQRISALEAISKRSADSLGGRLGSIEQLVRTLQSNTPDGKPLAVSAEDFAELKEEFPMLAEIQVRAFNKVLEKFKGTGISSDVLDGVVVKTREEAERAAEQRFIRKRADEFREEIADSHPNWAEIVGLPEQDGGPPPETEYRTWLKTQPADYQARVLNTYSASVVGRSIDKFHDWKTEHTNKATPASPKPAASTRQQQLRAAVQPRTSGGQPKEEKTLTEEEAMLASFEGRL